MELHQQAKNGEQRHFELKAGRELHVTQSKNQKTSRYAFSILAMRDQGKKVYQFQKRWLVLGLIPIAIMAALPQLQPYLPVDFRPYGLHILSGLFFLSLLFFMLLVNTFKRRYVFYSIHTRLPLVEFWMNEPSRKEFHHFISTLEDTIKQHKSEMSIPYHRQLAGETRTLRRVTEAGVLSESVYQAAKAKLLIMSDVNYRHSASKE